MDESEDVAIIKHGRVLLNDPFLQQMMVSVEGEMSRYVSYSVLRNPVQQVSAIVANVEDDDDPDPDPPAPKKTRPQKEKPSEVDMINLIPMLPDGDTRTSVPLTCAPCINGILVKGEKALDRGGFTCTIERLEYVVSRKKAFVNLTWDESADFTSRIPATSVRLPQENYNTLDPVSLDSMVCQIDRAYAVFSAIKRAIGLCRKKHSASFNVCPATIFTRQCVGFEADSARDNVRISEKNQSCQKINCE